MATKKATAAVETEVAEIRPANLRRATIPIAGITPYVQNAFSKKAREKMLADMATPRSERKGKSARPPRNYDEDFLQAQHLAVGGWVGIPCAAFRAAMVDACRTVNLVMTRAKMALKVIADGFDAVDGTPLLRLQAGAPERTEMLVRNDNGGADIRIRPMWREWRAEVVIEYDADMISATSIVNLLDRAGRQVGIGEGRMFSKNSVGMGWGEFAVVAAEKENAA